MLWNLDFRSDFRIPAKVKGFQKGNLISNILTIGQQFSPRLGINHQIGRSYSILNALGELGNSEP